MSYKPLTQADIDWYAANENLSARVMLQLERANALAKAVQADLRHSRHVFSEEPIEYLAACTATERAVILALASYLGEESP